MNKVKLGLIGSGFIADLHAAAALMVPELEIAGVASPTPGKAKHFALRQTETDVADGLHLALDAAEKAAAQRKGLRQADDFEERRFHVANSSTCQQAAR